MNPQHRRRSWPRTLARGAAAAFAFCLLSAETLSIEESELACEQAVAHVSHCCPSFVTSNINCTFTACESTPDLSPDESKCIEGLDCDTIRARGYCDSARLLTTLDGCPSNGACP